MLKDVLRALLLNRGQEDWDLVLPQLLRDFRGNSHTSTGETANMLMLGQELRLPDLLMSDPPPEPIKHIGSTCRRWPNAWKSPIHC